MDDEDNLDLVMFPTDGHFEPYEYKTSNQPTSKTNGRIFALKFSSSSQRHVFWMQSKPQAQNGDPSWFSPRDLKIGQIIDTLLQGEEVNVQEEIAQIGSGNGGNDDEDETVAVLDQMLLAGILERRDQELEKAELMADERRSTFIA